MTCAGGCGNCPDCQGEPGVDVIEQDEPELDGRPVPVGIVGPVRTAELPTRSGGAGRLILNAGARATKLANADARRKSLLVWCFGLGAGAEVLCLANTSGEAQEFTGAMIFAAGAVPVRYELAAEAEWWVRPGDIQSAAGEWEAFTPSTDGVIVSYIVENWAL